MAKARCKAKTRAGKRCKAYPLEGSDVCLAHSDEKVRDSMSFGGAHGGRPKKPRVVDVLRERIEDRIDEVLAPLFDALTASRGIALMIKGGGMELVYTPDHQSRLAAVRELLDRAYGKPKQATEISGPDGEPLAPIVLPSGEEWLSDIARVAARLPVANGRGNGNGSGPH